MASQKELSESLKKGGSPKNDYLKASKNGAPQKATI